MIYKYKKKELLILNCIIFNNVDYLQILENQL